MKSKLVAALLFSAVAFAAARLTADMDALMTWRNGHQ